MTILAEDLLLLLLDDQRGTVPGQHSDLALGGAVLADLALHEAVTVPEKTRVWRTARVRAVPGAEVEDPVLREALALVAAKQRSADELVRRLGKGLRPRLGDRLAEQGIVQRVDERVWGLVPRTRWPALDTSHEERLRRALTATLVSGAEPDQRTAALVALLAAVDRAHRSVDHAGLSNREVKRRAKEVAEGDWAAKAVRDAVRAATAATAAATTAAAGGAAAAGSG